MGPTPAAGATGRVERRTSLMADLMEAITSLAKRRGIVFQSSEIYGGLRSTWDYGPLGVEFKRNVKNAWWRAMVQLRDDIVGLDASILMSPRVWEASGHLESFSDPLAECTQCHERWRLDHLPGWEPGKTVAELRCPNDGGSLMDPRQFNLMFKTHMGPIEDEGSVAYLRPETAQAMFVDFVTIQAAARKKIPFGIAQIGKSFRNEITPGNFINRTREFEQLEMEFLVEPGTDVQWHEYWIGQGLSWYTDLGIRPENLRLREHAADELSHYSTRTVDVEYAFPFTDWGALEGMANRRNRAPSSRRAREAPCGSTGSRSRSCSYRAICSSAGTWTSVSRWCGPRSGCPGLRSSRPSCRSWARVAGTARGRSRRGRTGPRRHRRPRARSRRRRSRRSPNPSRSRR